MSQESKSHKLIDRKDNPDLYLMVEKLVDKHHQHLVDAKIILCWRYGWRANKDGHLTYGKCKKASDFEVEMADCDFIIFLNGDIWDKLTTKFQQAVLDHELCHAFAEKEFDEDGDEVDKYRIRRHDLEEFNEIVERHGLWRKEVEEFIQIGKDKEKGIFDDSLGDE